MDEDSVRIDEFLHSIALKLPHSRITPLEVGKIQRQFLRKRECPDFTYQPMPEDIPAITQQLNDLVVPHCLVQDLLQAKKEELLQKSHMLQSVGTADFEKATHKVYAKPTKRLLDKAYGLLDLPDVPKSPYIKRLEARRLLRESMKSLGFMWKIKNEDMATSAKVDPMRRVLVLRRKERFRKKFVQRLAIHEIGTHALRAENGALQPLKMFMHGLPGYLDTEEGLAAFNEERAGILDNATLKNYAGRVVAVDLALQHSFTTTFTELRKHFSARQASQLTIRVKRGLERPQDPGAFTRDATYLRGYLAVKKFSETGWIYDLFLGKIGIDNVDMVKKIPGVIPARYVPESIYSLIQQS